MIVTSILVVNMNYLGDALMTTPAIRAIKHTFPTSKIDVIAGATATYGAFDILSLDPDIDQLIPRASGGSFHRGRQLFTVIKAGKYDLVVVLPSLPFYSFIAKLTGRRVVTVPKADETKHMADHMLDSITAQIPLDSVSRSLVMAVPGRADQFTESTLGKLEPDRGLIAFNVGASRPQKRWPAVHFAACAKLVVEAGFNLVLIGGQNEQDIAAAETVMAEFTTSDMPNVNNIVNLVGETTLEQLSAVIGKSSVVVTADTGAMHIASALNIPLVTLFGSTSPGFTGPYGEGGKNIILDLALPCAPCITHPTCNGRYDCMTGIRPEDVFASILKLTTVFEESTACGMA